MTDETWYEKGVAGETDLQIGSLRLVDDELGYCVELAVTWKRFPAKTRSRLTISQC